MCSPSLYSSMMLETVLYFCLPNNNHKPVVQETQNEFIKVRDKRHMSGTGRRIALRGQRRGWLKMRLQKIPKTRQRTSSLNSHFRIAVDEWQDYSLGSGGNGVWEACSKAAKAIQMGQDGGKEVKDAATAKKW